MDYKKIFLDNSIELNDDQFAKLEKYADLLVEWNEKFNLTAITNRDDIFVKHFLDCCLLAKEYNPTGTICDVGTGAGFPGVVLKIYNPDLEVCLLEPNNKKITFLNEVIHQLNLSGISTVCARSEDFAKNNFESFDYVTARAVAALNILSELTMPLLKVNGHFLAMKGPKGNQELQDASKAIEILGGKAVRVQTLGLNEENTRIIIDIEKVKHTPSKYPRNYGAIKKKPL